MLRLKGILMITIGSMCWGATGPMMEWILDNTHMSVPILLTVRVTLAGILLLSFMFIRKEDIFAVWKTPYWRNQLIIFSIFGMLGLQYTFLTAIEASNSIVATLLQFLGPIFVALYVSLRHREFPPRYQIIGIAGTLIGLFLLLTNGSVGSLLVSTKALLWGLGLGLTFAFYTLYPVRLMQEWSVLIIVGWSMLISGSGLAIGNHVWTSNEWSLFLQPGLAVLLIFLILFGTMAFVLFLSSMKYITAVETSILSSVEPLTAMIISAIWFGSMLQSVQLLGALLMFIFVTWMSIGRRNVPKGEKCTQCEML